MSYHICRLPKAVMLGLCAMLLPDDNHMKCHGNLMYIREKEWSDESFMSLCSSPSLCASQQSREVLASLKPQQQFLSSGLGYSGLQDSLVFVFASWLNVWVHLCLLTRDALFICASLCAYIKKRVIRNVWGHVEWTYTQEMKTASAAVTEQCLPFL